MGRRPSREHSINRIDNEKGYGPDNCEWADRLTQQGNTRVSTRVTYQGETLCLSEWTRRLNLSFGIVSQRMNRLGWSAERALTTSSQATRWLNRKPKT
jgi:hypothetical protein